VSEKRRFKQVKQESQATDVVVISIYGWKGDRRLEPRTVRGYFRCNEAAQWDLVNGGKTLDTLSDKILEQFKEKAPEGQKWSISEGWSRRAERC